MNTILWFQKDLRLEDNPALNLACQSAGVIPLFIVPEDIGSASKVWLHGALKKLTNDLEKTGSKLILQEGPADKVLLEIAQAHEINSVIWTKTNDPILDAQNEKIKKTLESKKISVQMLPGNLLFEPHEIKNLQNSPFKVFTAFYNACLKKLKDYQPQVAPQKIPAPKRWPKSVDLDQLKLLPQIKWHKEMIDFWSIENLDTKKTIKNFIEETLSDYSKNRDIPSIRGTSLVSPFLVWGQISVKHFYHFLNQFPQSAPYQRQLIWREFAYHLLNHFPESTKEPMNFKFKNFPWEDKKQHRLLKAWQKGLTGYPLVDAGMRQLWQTGWMHNRVRMVVASFLTKDLFISWQTGARWFMDTLVDADLANNTMGWQWVAGCGVDAAPYFRIFNPITQSEKFDPEGAYIKKYVPELKNLPIEYIHAPWLAPADILEKAGVILGKNYPLPLVNHSAARQKALALYHSLK
jgi:deoxyribodipyrimidine photo-lyase